MKSVSFALRKFSTTGGKIRHFAPDKILPSGKGQVRVINNTVRDGQQSNLSAEMADEHRQHVGKLINEVYKDMDAPVGYEQIWGGTVPMFDIWKRGVHPFESLREMTAFLPHTPTSALIRGNALNSMGNQPRDVVDGFIRAAAEGGVDVFTNFDAHNDWRNHVSVAEAVHKYGKHYQAALSWAVHQEDPTIYNVQWAVDFFKEISHLKPHSLYVKDPSGVLTPEMAGLLAACIKDAFPDLPLIFHTHYQTGYGYMSYLKAVENGANGVECSLGLADGAAQPFGLTMLRTFEDMGYKTGNPNKAAMQKVTDVSNELRKLYTVGRLVRVPDIRVELVGIAGGQRTILDKELRDVGQAHLIPAIDTEVQRVRDEGGKVCQVTPVADSYAREAMRRLRGGDPNKNFAPGYAAILTGENGLVKEPVDPVKQKQALTERGTTKIKDLLNQGVINLETSRALESHVLPTLRKQMDTYAEASVARQRIAEVKKRLEQLATISKKEHLLSSLNRKITLARAKDKRGRAINNVQDRILSLKEELTELEGQLKKAYDLKEQDYEKLLRREGSQKLYDELIAGGHEHLRTLLSSKALSLQAFKELVAHSGVITLCAADLLPNGMGQATAEIKALDQEQVLGLATEGERALRENAVVQASYRTTAIPGLVTNFWKNYRENPNWWSPLFDGHIHSARLYPKEEKKGKKAKDTIRRVAHDRLTRLVGHEGVNELVGLRKNLIQHQQKLGRFKSLGDRYGKATLAVVEEKIASLEQKFKAAEKKAVERLEQVIRARPGILHGAVPVVQKAGQSRDVVLSPPSPTEELQLASTLLSELVAMESQS